MNTTVCVNIFKKHIYLGIFFDLLKITSLLYLKSSLSVCLKFRIWSAKPSLPDIKAEILTYPKPEELA